MTSADVIGQDRRPPVDPEEELPGGFAGLRARAWLNLRTGNLGPAPIIVGLVITVAIFGLTATNFFTATNFANLITESAGTAMLAYGVVFVLLSVRSTSRSATWPASAHSSSPSCSSRGAAGR